MKGLVMEGGALRGMFTAGVTDVMLEHGIEFDAAVGVSAGSSFGCNYKSKQIGRALRYNLRFANDKRYCSIESLIKTGDLFNARFCYHILPEKLDLMDEKTYMENPLRFYCAVTDVKTGKPLYHDCKELNENTLEWMRASASLPLVANIVKVDGYELLDGGLTDSIPIRWMESQGCDKNVIILTRPAGYRKKPQNKIFMAIMKHVYKDYPELLKAISLRHTMYNAEIDYINEIEKAGKAFVIRPEQALDIHRVEHNKAKIQGAYDAGRSVMLKRIAELKEYLEV
ncbi:Predicted phospholipase, patatin/cPLA2 family [Lachnospiraceae bacterium KH1T2]|nr:Predicted phospholipase, patatin/cPLA2 family [Lachnospiraceae bacterium KH1T2]